MKGHVFHEGLFRRYDARGIVGDTLTLNDARAIGAAFATMVSRAGRGSRVCTARDGRASSLGLERALVDGLSSCGADIVRLGLGPTPMLYLGAKVHDAAGAIMVTGSHNPPEYNGFKFVLDNKPFYGEELQDLRGVAEAGDTDPAEGSVSEAAGVDRYVARVLDDAQLDRDLAVGWDAGNGAAGVAFAQLCGSLRGRHVRINEEVNDTFPAHHPDPTVAANLAQLQEVVLSEGLDVGFAFDGDGDRLGVIDETGRILWADQVLALLVPEVLTAHPGAPIIADVKCSQVLFDRILELGGDPIMWSTGHSLIKAKMLETGAPLAGEMSGHLFFADRYFGFDDALYAAVRLLNVLARDGRSLSALADELPATVSTPEIRVHCTDARKFEVVSAISDRLIARGADVILIDGVRVRALGGWWLIRASNTEPALVVRCEAPDAGALSVLLGEVAESLEACGVVTGAALRPD